VLSKATGERVWNGTTYVPTERPTAEELAKQTFHTAALVDETDRDPADIVLRQTVASTGSFEVAHFGGE
jgi:N-acyl-D-aspartate/D-glutamate deacylase